MIAGCIERMSQHSCGGCERRDNCSFIWPEALGFLLSSGGEAKKRDGTPGAEGNPFFAFLREVAKAVDGSIKSRETPFRPAETPFRGEVERRVEPPLASGTIRVGEVARDLGVRPQTLYRRLKAEGATFETVLDGLRHRLALRLVRDQGLSVKEAAWRLGFSDPTPFSRAFKRWTGTSPRAPKAT